MSALKVGDSFPEGVVFSYVPYTPETSDITACGISINYDASKGLSPHPFSPLPPPQLGMLTPQTEFADKKVVLFAVPGAFTPSCSVKHLPGYIENVATLKSKGVDIIAVIAYNDAYVMSAWGKANGIKDGSIVRPPFLVPDFQSPPLFTSPNPRHP